MKTIETVRATVTTARNAKVAATVNFAILRDTFVVGSFPNVWVDGYYGKVNGAVIGCRDKRYHLPEFARCVEHLKGIGFKVRRLPGGFEQYTVT